MRCVPAFLTLLALAPMAAGADTVTVRVVADPDERRPAVGGFEIIRTGSTTAAQPVSYLVLGSAAEGTDFTAIARSATIAAGATSARVAVRAIEDGVGDGVIDAAETVRIQLVPPSGMAVGSPDSATLVIADGQPALSVTALGALDEASPGASAAFRISFPGRPLPSRTITATLSYSGANGGYTAPGGVVQIPAGLTEVEVAIFPVADAVRTGDRTLTATLVAGSGYTVGSATAAMTLRDDEPVLAISGSATVAEGATCALAVSRDRALPTALVVPLTVAGSATTADRTVPASVTIAAGATSARIVVTARQDSLAESTETVVVGIVTSTAWAVAPASAAATVTILDDEPVVGFLGGDRTVAQGATTALVVARSSTAGALTVRFAIPAGATTASRSDLLTIPAGAATAAVTVRVLADASFPAERDLAVALAAQPADAPRYRIAGTAAIVIRALATAQTVGIAPLVGSVEEGAAGDAFILERAGTAEMIAAALRVDLALVASASSATAADLVAVPAQAVFAAAATRAVVTIAAADDRLPEPATEALVLRIAGADAPITIAAAASRAAVAIRDRAPRVRISRAADALEGGDLRFEITVDPAAGAAVAVPWSVAGAITAADLASGAATSGTAVVAAGAATAAITVATRDDLAAEADESAVLTIAPGAGLVLSGPATAAATLVDITPSVVVGWIADGAEPALPARFIVAYGGTALARPATVALTATGPVGGVPATVTIPAGATSATLRLLPIDDRAVQAPRQVVVAIAAVDGSARASGTAAAWILDDDPGIRVVNEPDEVVVPAGSTWSHRVRVTLSDRAVQGPLTAALVAPPGGSAPPSWLTIGTPEELETGTVEIPLDGIAAGAGPVLVRIAITAAIPDDPESVTVSTVDLILVVAPAGAGEG